MRMSLVNFLAEIMQEAARATQGSCIYNREHKPCRANAGKVQVVDTVIIKAHEPLTHTAKWGYGFVVSKVNGKVLTILNSSTGVKQLIARDQVHAIDPDSTCDEVAP